MYTKESSKQTLFLYVVDSQGQHLNDWKVLGTSINDEDDGDDDDDGSVNSFSSCLSFYLST